MSSALRSALRAAALLAAAVLCAALANILARPDRKLAWSWAQAPAVRMEPLPIPEPPPAAPSPAPAPVRARPEAPHPAHVPPSPAPAPSRFPWDPSAVTREISAQDAWDAYALHLPFLDARRTADFTEGHVPGAWSVPVWEDHPEARITDFEARANPGSRDPIVLYCSGGGCEDARLLADRMVALGYRNLLIYSGGFPDWAARSRPVAKGARP